MKTILSLLLFCSSTIFCIAADIPFEAVDSDGNTASGIVTTFDAEQLVLDAEGTKIEIPTEKLVKLQSLFENPFLSLYSPTNETSTNSPINIGSYRNKTRVENRSLKPPAKNSDETKSGYPDVVSVLELKDGTRLVVTDFTAKGQLASCRLLNNEEITLPLNQLLAVRLVVKGLTEVAAPSEDWRKLAAKTEKGDRIVVGQPGSLDIYVGILAEVSKETISFIVDGETLPVPRRKVFGLLFHTPENAQISEPLPQLGFLTFWNGTVASLHSLKRDQNGKWSWMTVSGISGTLLPEEIDEFDLGQKNAFYLTDLKPTLLQQAFFFDQETSAKTESLTLLQTFRTNKMISKAAKREKIFPPQYRTNSRQKNIPDHPLPGLEGFVLEGVSYNHGLAIPAKTIIEYTLAEPFVAFHAVTGIDDRLRPGGAVLLRIEANHQQLGNWEFHGGEPAKPLKLNLPPGTKTLKFEVDFAQGLSAPDILTLADPKLIK